MPAKKKAAPTKIPATFGKMHPMPKPGKKKC